MEPMRVCANLDFRLHGLCDVQAIQCPLLRNGEGTLSESAITMPKRTEDREGRDDQYCEVERVKAIFGQWSAGRDRG